MVVRKRRLMRPIIVALGAVTLLVFLHVLGPLIWLENIVSRALSPAQQIVYRGGQALQQLYDNPEDLDSFSTEELKEQLLVLISENAQLKTTIEAMKRSNQQLEYIEGAGLNGITARVLGRSLQPERQTLVVNRGSEDAVMVGQPVIAENGILIGLVYSVNAFSSQVLLLNDSQSAIAAVIQNESLTKGVVVGQRGLSMRMELLPQDEIVAVGDLVVTSGVEVAVPAGLVVGQVESVEVERNGFFQTALLRPLVNPQELATVTILQQAL